MSDKEIQYLKDNFDFKELKKAKFFDDTISETDYEKQIKRICKYFGFNSIFEYDTVGVDQWKPIETNTNIFSNN